MKLLILNGPNLNLLGLREPDIYGKQTFADLQALLQKTADEEGVIIDSLDIRLQEIIKKQHPDIASGAFISHKNLTYYRLLFLEEIIDKANRKNDYVREAVYDATKHQGYTALDVQDQLDRKITFGQKIADDVARFGGSWTFIITFICFMGVWMALNVLKPLGIVFDKYPFILLNLALSTLAAIQAPLIMMSQNRQAKSDRERSELQYNINLKCEVLLEDIHIKLEKLIELMEKQKTDF